MYSPCCGFCKRYWLSSSLWECLNDLELQSIHHRLNSLEVFSSRCSTKSRLYRVERVSLTEAANGERPVSRDDAPLFEEANGRWMGDGKDVAKGQRPSPVLFGISNAATEPRSSWASYRWLVGWLTGLDA